MRKLCMCKEIGMTVNTHHGTCSECGGDDAWGADKRRADASCGWCGTSKATKFYKKHPMCDQCFTQLDKRPVIRTKVVIVVPKDNTGAILGLESAFFVQIDDSPWYEIGALRDIVLNIPYEDVITVDMNLLPDQIEIHDPDHLGEEAIRALGLHQKNKDKAKEKETDAKS